MNWAEQLEKLQQLHQQGALTDDEYAAAKARVIRDLGPAPAAQAARAAIEQSQTAMRQLKRSVTDRWLPAGLRRRPTSRLGRGVFCLS
jgi:membrane peptidoglycan carboxypeptidase